MSALSVAFDITIVGALALSWVVLTIDLFFVSKEQRLIDVLKSLAQGIPASALGVLLFAMAYFLGTAVSRIAQDFFNDDDLARAIHIRHWITEDNIRAQTYCDSSEQAIVERSLNDTPVTRQTFCDFCEHYKQASSAGDQDSKEQINEIFYLQESALLLNGEDKTARLRQYHDQIIVLGGAAFNGLIAFWLSVFGVCARYRTKVRWIAPCVLLAAAVIAAVFHYKDRPWEPPFMEFTLFVLAAAGFYLVWKRTNRNYTTVALFSLLFTLIASLSWWWTEVLYDDRVIYSFYALGHKLAQ